MNWIKKQFRKLFSTIDDENDYEEAQKENKEVYEEKQYTAPEQTVQRRSSFRFPLIADEEIISNQTEQENELNERPKDRVVPFALPNEYPEQHSKSEVFEVEQSRISELLAERRGERRKAKKEPVKREVSLNRIEERRNLEQPKKRTKTEEKSFTREIINPLENRKRFVPTEVPSPVYGFSKPSSIQTLLKNGNVVLKKKNEESVEQLNNIENDKKQEVLEEINKATEEVASTIVTVNENEHSINPLPTTEEVITTSIQEDVLQEEKNEQQLQEQIPMSFVQNENEPASVQQKNDESIKETTNLVEEVVENVEQIVEEVVEEQEDYIQEQSELPTLEETDSIVEQHTEDEFITSEIDIEQENYHEQQEKETSKRRGTIPFNVIMLKSDKEKLLQKMASQQLTLKEEEFTHQDQLQHSQVAKLVELAEQDKNIYETTTRKEEQNNTEKEEITHHVIEEQHESIEQVQHEQQRTNKEAIEQSTIENNNNEHQTERKQTETNTLPKKQYVKPPLEYLAPPEEKTVDKEWMESQAEVLVEALSHFQVTAHVESIVQGPAVTQFEITVGHGIKVSKIRNLADDLKLALAAKDIRIQAPIPGKSSIGIEIPNRISRAVQLSEITTSESFIESDSPLEAALGLDLTGKPVTIDLRKMPHGMIAGATGSGKSVCINSILVSLLYKADPQELKLMLIDPKMVELAPFNHIPHLVSPVITDVKAATAALKWAVDEMERRYKLFAHVGVRDLSRYNKQVEQNGDYGNKLPYILIVIDELADLMMMSPADVEEAICRIAQKARACGIHLIIATQRPSVDVITGLIKSNIPTRIAFAVSSQVDSRTILDQQGAERLLGRGDMLYLGNGMSAPIRIQGTFVTDDEIEQIVDHVRQQGEPEYFFEEEELLKKAEIVEEYDELFEDVCRYAYEQGSASTSSIQRRFHIGYNRAARLIDMLESHGFVSEAKGSKPRDVFITESDLTEIFG